MNPKDMYILPKDGYNRKYLVVKNITNKRLLEIMISVAKDLGYSDSEIIIVEKNIDDNGSRKVFNNKF